MKKIKKNLPILAVLTVAFVACSVLLSYNPETETASVQNDFQTKSAPTTKSDEWNLILVNKQNPIPSNFEVDCEEVAQDQYADKRMAVFLKEMLSCAQAQNCPLYIVSSYRSVQRQELLYKTSYQKNLNEGLTPKEAKEKTEQYQAPPGTSEHATGLAFDIVGKDWFKTHSDLTDDFDTTAAYKWLSENAYKYGFILRYPKDKEEVTGYSYEPWHYRFVGVDAAKIIKENNLCLEEYLRIYN